jgi:hypothetical protein
MIIWKNTKNNRLYLMYQSKHHYWGMLTAEPYGWFGPIITDAKIKNFVQVAIR